MEILYDFLHPKIKKQNDIFLRFCIRTPFLLRTEELHFSFLQKLTITTFLNNSPILHGFLIYPLYFITLGLIGIRKPSGWVTHHFFKNLKYPALIYAPLFISVKCIFPNEIIETVFEKEIQHCQSKGYLDNKLLYDKVTQLNVLSQLADEKQNDNSKKAEISSQFKSQIKIFQNVQQKLSLHQDSHIRKIIKVNQDEDDQKQKLLKKDISEFFDQIITK